MPLSTLKIQKKNQLKILKIRKSYMLDVKYKYKEIKSFLGGLIVSVSHYSNQGLKYIGLNCKKYLRKI